MTVASLGSAAASAAPAARKQTLDQSDFIRLLTTQLKMQDPTDPVDNKETIAQMAQFSSLSGLDQINSTLKAISAQLTEALATRSATQE